MIQRSFKVGDKVKAIPGNNLFGTKAFQCIEIVSISPDGKWLGFNLPTSEDDEDEFDENGKPNFDASCFELIESKDFN